jgi:hypothetical protein
MIDPRLRPECGLIPHEHMGEHPSLFVADIDWSTWKMQTNHAAHTFTGDVAAGQKRMLRSNFNHPDTHRGVFFKNPHMMYLCEHGSDIPLLSLDVHAWLLCSYLTGRVPLPPAEEMKKANIEQFLDQMHLPVIRLKSDEAYYGIICSKAEYWGGSDGSSSEDESSSEDDSDADDGEVCPYDLDELEYGKYQLRLLCKVMEEGKYPGVPLGNYESLTRSSSTVLCLMRREFVSRLITPRIRNGEPLETQLSKPSLFFRCTRAPRQGLSINDGWIPKKEDIQLFKAEMYERACATRSCFDS